MQVMGTPSTQASTVLMEDPHNVAKFCSFLVARGVVSTTLAKHISAIRKVLAWRSSLAQPTSRHARLQAVIRWVDVLHKQSHNAGAPSRSVVHRSNLPTAKEVLGFQLQVEKLASQLLAEDTMKWGGMHRQVTYKAAQDSAMLALCFGYLPPLRLGCIRTCLHPDFVMESGGCLEEECR